MNKWVGLALALGLTVNLTGCDSSSMGKFNGNAKEAQALYARVAGTDKAAFDELQTKANEGNQYAALQLGYILHTGTGGITPDYNKAADYYEAASHIPAAKYNIALLYVNKLLSRPDRESNVQEAIVLLQAAAERANADFVLPLITLGQIYEKGIGITANPELAASWYEKAANHSDPMAQFKLGQAYLKGAGRPLNPYLAEKWFNIAADRWSTDAQLQLGMLMANKDYHGYKPVAAGKWFFVASTTRPEYRPISDEYFTSLTVQEQAAARRMAESWMKGHQQMPITPDYNKPTNKTL